jgi:hypothetical protein
VSTKVSDKSADGETWSVSFVNVNPINVQLVGVSSDRPRHSIRLNFLGDGASRQT